MSRLGSDQPILGRKGTLRKLMSIKWRENSGFTAIEAIAVVVIIGILASAVTYRYSRSPGADAALAANQLIADIQYVQMRAIGIGHPQSIRFFVGKGSYSICEGSTCEPMRVIEEKNLPDPDYVMIRSTNLVDNRLTFNTIGEPTFGTTASGIINLGMGTNTYKTITISPITGKVQ